jgi:hypothetical protein
MQLLLAKLPKFYIIYYLYYIMKYCKLFLLLFYYKLAIYCFSMLSCIRFSNSACSPATAPIAIYAVKMIIIGHQAHIRSTVLSQNFSRVGGKGLEERHAPSPSSKVPGFG